MQLASAGSVTRAASGEFDARAALDEGLELKGAAFGTRGGRGSVGGWTGGWGGAGSVPKRRRVAKRARSDSTSTHLYKCDMCAVIYYM